MSICAIVSSWRSERSDDERRYTWGPVSEAHALYTRHEVLAYTSPRQPNAQPVGCEVYRAAEEQQRRFRLSPLPSVNPCVEHAGSAKRQTPNPLQQWQSIMRPFAVLKAQSKPPYVSENNGGLRPRPYPPSRPPQHLPHFLLAAYASTKPIPDPLPASRFRRRSCHPYPATPAKNIGRAPTSAPTPLPTRRLRQHQGSPPCILDPPAGECVSA
jgi:hypothetical protein